MTMSVAHTAEEARALRGLLPLWVGSAIYALFLLAGNRLLIDPDTMWQITIGQWILDHRAVPVDRRLFLHHARPALDFDAVAGAGALRQNLCDSRAGAGPVVLAAAAIAATFALLTKFLSRHLSESTTLVFVAAALALTRAASAGAAACAGDAGHGGLGRRTDRGRRSPRGAVVLAAAADGAVGQSAWRLCLRPGADRAGRARCGAERGCRVAEIAGAALGGIRAGGAARGLLHALWLEFAAGVAKDSRPRRRAAADHGMEAGRISAASARSRSACCWASGSRCFAASRCRRCASCCCSDCCTWR